MGYPLPPGLLLPLLAAGALSLAYLFLPLELGFILPLVGPP